MQVGERLAPEGIVIEHAGGERGGLGRARPEGDVVGEPQWTAGGRRWRATVADNSGKTVDGVLRGGAVGPVDVELVAVDVARGDLDGWIDSEGVGAALQGVRVPARLVLAVVAQPPGGNRFARDGDVGTALAEVHGAVCRRHQGDLTSRRGE